MGFETGLSGLDANSRYLDAIGNNVSNASVVGFKQSQLSFSDIYAASLSGGTGTTVGLGTQVSAVQQQFSQGGITATSNPLEMAINGNGFFKLASADGQSISYTRNGQFHKDKDGFVVNAQSQHLQGFPYDFTTQKVTSSITSDIQLPTAPIPAHATSLASMEANLNAAATVPTVATFNPTNANSYNNVVPVSVYDSQGSSHTLSVYFAKSSTVANGWNVYYTLDNSVTPVTPTSDAVTFNASGTIDTPSPNTLSLSLDIVPATITGGGPQAVSLDVSKLTQFGGQGFGVTRTDQDGYTSGTLTGFSVGTDGIVQGTYTNNQTRKIAQVPLVTFPSPEGLAPIGNNQWVETSASGVANVTAAGTGLAGAIQPSAVEASNVDLTKELVNMIVAQRGYQANAQTIKTEDQILSTLVNLR